ncbi:DENN domain-containing protein 1A-like isoform X6 [Homarus americanus]|uniref:DENN domain-containing protein 1A-like isoform X6 n=1 Tax=Homarus americanus TaxID=6706 RepID=UPI001C4658F1|nr:DENN domain-containing protein 1A-like isoform X6 [Homarus americanus]
MGSRLRENPKRLLECWCEVVGPKGRERPAWIIQKFPNSYDIEEVLKSVPQFAFPCSFESSNVQHFSFVLTSLDSKWTYGFCRHAPGAETALVLLSHLPWHETFYKLLNHLSEMMSSDRTSDMASCLQNIYKSPVPHPGSEITVPYGDSKFFVAQCPNHLKLPTIPENRNLSEYYNAVDTNNMIIIFASMLYERRIIMMSKRLSRLSACVQAANSVIYPMQWQHIFIPVLPQHLLDYLLAPMPFLIGVNTLLLAKVQMDDVGEAVILDADNNTVKTPFNDVDTLPDEVVINLKRNLKSSNNMLGDSVARAFLRALVQLIGNYKEALQFREEDSRITFNREKFVAIRPPNFQPFVEKMLELQIFQQFIEERLERLNSGKQTSDEFELEVSVYCEKSSSKVKQQYKQFVTNVRKEGGAIVKTMKNKSPFRHLKSNSNTVTKGSKQVKEKSRQTYKDLRGKIKDFQQPRVEDGTLPPTWINGESPQKPRSAPSSPVLGVKRRPRTVGGNMAGYSAKATYKRASQINIREDCILPGAPKYELIDTDSGLMSPGSTDSLSTPSPQSIDLIGEMEEIIRAKLGQESEVDGEPGHSSTGGSNSATSSVHNSPGSESASGSTSTVTMLQSLKDHPPSLMASKRDGSSQDLIFLESPQDEIFDPLYAKDLPQKTHPGGRPAQPPPPVPTSKSTSSLPGASTAVEKGVGVGSLSTSQLPGTTAPHPALSRSTAINTTGLPNATPKRPSEYRLLASYQPRGSEYRQFSSLQTSMGTPIGCQNPIYNQHQPPGVASLPSTTRAGNAAAAFATSMLSQSSEETSTGTVTGRPSPYVQFEPPFAQHGKASSTTSQPQRPPRLSERDLLGDFSKDFQKLTLNSPSKTATAGNNNNTIVNNNKAPLSNSDTRGASENKWATFD